MPGPGQLFLAATGDTSGPGGEAVRGFQSVTWTGWDGSVWDLLGTESGMFLSGAVRGLGMPEVNHYRSESPAVAGSRWRGHRIEQREVFLPLFLFTDVDAQEWVQRDQAFWRTMQPDKTGLLTVTRPSGMSRSLRLRFESDGGHSFPSDPSQRGWELYGVTLTAEDPYWAGDPIVQEWTSLVAGADFFPGPPFEFASGHTLASAKLDNHGDVPSWPVWTLSGPFTEASVGVDGQTIEVPFSLTGGESLVIDTDPREQTAITGAGVDRTGDLGAVGFAAVPPGHQVPLELILTGTGSVSVSLPLRFYRAW